MPKFKDITLSSGEQVRVYVPPSIKVSELLLKKYPDPEPPVVEEKTATGETIKMIIEDDPEYLAEKAAARKKRDDKLNELSALYAMRDVKVPEGWDIEAEQGELIRLADPDWKPREGSHGIKLDYIEWDLLGNSVDVLLMQETLAELSGINLEVIARIEAQFRGDVEGQTAQGVVAEGGE